MSKRSRTYEAYGIASAAVWLAILAVTAGTPTEERRQAIRLTCAGWWLGWLSATIARWVYPPPRRWRPSS